ncbi:MerR family transcriptional regulator [Micromonospora peucetia]|uniref:MerR family transcriptional regulator n=1 Tax=Micromonospora peucetia TaxID=47871 RepID=A0ABZ1E9N6_9ACTN|nr:MerR family transcriptional regulator [Micromonospora peucetia]MCX4388468.1 MerR family transcriptional regulator [Micromonospora peucetia]WSA30870.1 MerR family transcriptional regulator [Micromonospora peucetia]
MDTSIREPTLTVGGSAERVGLTTYTLRWYEQEGLVAPVGRDSAGRRRYTERDVNSLVLLTRLRRTGMPVRDMRRYAELARQGDGTLGTRRALFEAHRARVLTRMAELEEDLKGAQPQDRQLPPSGGGPMIRRWGTPRRR